MSLDRREGGWSLVAETDGAVRLLATLVDLDPTAEYTKSDLAEAADVPLKTLFLANTVETFVEAGILEPTDVPSTEREARYRVDDECPLYEAACAFDAAAERSLAPAASD
mgnify:CR=1 FL=1